MKTLFQYNWQVRDDWFTWCEGVPEEELLMKRVGGVGGILYTMFHIVEVERSWIHFLKTKQDPGEPPFEDYASLEKVKALSNQFHTEIEPFIMSWTNEMDSRSITVTNPEGQSETFRHGEIMRHVIAHEIHHIGQLSIWARELGREPVTANLFFRGLFE
ncbi:DinB family protein [Bacillus sp. JJ1562]|uniref:DinB family protein n=1 Tax=Bacillus sp. JJ1562 TaxID=3122960 RepID=UPI00300391AE